MILKRTEDMRSLFFLLVMALFMVFTAFLEMNFFSWLCLYVLGSFFVFIVAVINHNHRHFSIFRNDFLNLGLNSALTIFMGGPSTRLHQVHLLNHHRHYKNLKDWTSYSTQASGHGPLRIFKYVLNSVITIRQQRRHLWGQVQGLDRQYILEVLVLLLFMTVNLWLHWQIVLLLWIPMWLTGLGLLLISNLLNHDGCEVSTKYNHSRDFVSSTENWFFLNNGFHTIHHLKPRAHWADLPEMHERLVQPYKSEVYVEESMLKYLREYLIGKSWVT